MQEFENFYSCLGFIIGGIAWGKIPRMRIDR